MPDGYVRRRMASASRTACALLPLRAERNLVRLFLLPDKIRKEIEKKSRIARDDALLMQFAVALMILTYAPIRIDNLAGLREKNLRWQGRTAASWSSTSTD